MRRIDRSNRALNALALQLTKLLLPETARFDEPGSH